MAHVEVKGNENTITPVTSTPLVKVVCAPCKENRIPLMKSPMQWSKLMYSVKGDTRSEEQEQMQQEVFFDSIQELHVRTIFEENKL